MDGIDKQSATELGAAVKEALREVADRFGLRVEYRGGTYDRMGVFRPRVEFTTDDKAENEFRAWADVYGLSPDDFGATFASGGRTFEITGVSPRSRVRPILAREAVSGQGYKFPAAAVARALGRRP